MSISVRSHHAIDYIEFHVTDMDAAKAFYVAAFGWEFNDYGPEYAGIKHESGDGEVGGLSVSAKVQQGGPLVVLYSSDIEASMVAVKAAGGEISRELFEFPGGLRFQFRDPSGNELGVWSKS